MPIYLDTNVYYYAYCPVEDQTIIEWLFAQLTKQFQGISCEWCLIEMFRALKKQVNLGAIDEKDAQITLDYFLSDVGEMIQKNILKLIPVTYANIIASRKPIFTYNLYAADALHAISAIKSQAQAFITFDSDFKANLGNIPVLNPMNPSFKNSVLKLTKKAQDQ